VGEAPGTEGRLGIEGRGRLREPLRAHTSASGRLQPIKVHVSGDLAVVLYSATLKMTNIETGESQVEEQVRWMDAHVKEDGRWTSIAEHGIKMPTD